MNMDNQTAHLEQEELRREAEILRSELEQMRVALEDMDQRISELVAVNGRLTEELQTERSRRRQAETQVERLAAAPAPVVQPDTAREDGLREQLGNALEELRVMAEELSLAQESLRQATISR